MFKKAIAIFLVFVLCWGNTGFCLNVHYCDTSKAFSVMVNHIIGEKCDKDSPHDKGKPDCESKEQKSCCKKLKQSLPSSKKDCCSNTEVEVKIHDAFQGSFHQFQIQKKIESVPFIAFADYFGRFTSIVGFVEEVVDPPDVPQEILTSGQDLLIQNCVYRI